MAAKTRFFLLALLSLPLGWDLALGQSHVGDVRLTEQFSIGREVDEGILFGRVRGLAVDSQQRIFVADRQGSFVAVFSGDGQELGIVGGHGEGPGEYASVDGVYVGPADSIYIADGAHSRLLVYDPSDLMYVRQIRYPYDPDLGATNSAVGISPIGPVMSYAPMILPDNAEEARYRSAVQTSWTGQYIREIARAPDLELRIRMSGGRPVVSLLDYARSPHFRLGDDYVLYSGWNATIDIRMTSLMGDSIGTIRQPHVPEHVSRSDVQAGEPEFKPAYRTFLVDDQGHIWLKGYVEAPSPDVRWQVLDSDGALIGQVMLPRTLRLYEINTRKGRAYGVLDGETGEHMVVVYSVEY